MGESNNVRVGQTATDEYAVHQFKDYVSGDSAIFECELQSDLAPSGSVVCLQIYNHDSSEWETIDSNNSASADTDFTLNAEIIDLTNYKDNNIVTCRVYQNAT